MAIQRQERRGTRAENDAFTGAEGEFLFLTDENRGVFHDGSTQGGIILPNSFDQANQSFCAANAVGTDTITLTVPDAPAAYANLQKYVFKAAATNTAGVTINVNGLGAKTVLKKDKTAGALVALVAGDIILSGVYVVYYNGTNFIIDSIDGGGIQNVSQGDLNTSTGTFSQAISHFFSGSSAFKSTSSVTVPGGQYGFAIETRNCATQGFWVPSRSSSSYAQQVSACAIENDSNGVVNVTPNGQQRYVTSSPPFDMGDGDAQGFLYLILDKNGEFKGHYFADVPPWGYNGPTNIRACKKCPMTGKKYRKVLKQKTIKQALETEKLEYEYQEITQAIKNADMELLPTPFDNLPVDQHVTMIDPMDEKLARMLEYQNADGGAELSDMLQGGFLTADQDKAKRKGPKNVGIHKLKIK